MFVGVVALCGLLLVLVARYLPDRARSKRRSAMWPFVSTLLRPSSSEQGQDEEKSKPKPKPDATSPSPPPPSFAMSPPEDDGDATPKAKASTPAGPAPPRLELGDAAMEDDEDDDDDLPPPCFPALNSSQRASPSSSLLSGFSTSPSSMPPPPLPPKVTAPTNNTRPSPAAAARGAPPSAAAKSRLAVVGQGARGVAGAGGLNLPNGRPNSKSKSRKVVLEPGHSPLDWARLQKSGVDLRGLPTPALIKVPPSLLAQHRKAPADIWMALNGRVYNVTAYLPFHPGGDRELLRAAGKDGTKMFNATHPWVNVDGMLGECLVGILVSEEEAKESGSALEEVD